jgi:hypothetical protein
MVKVEVTVPEIVTGFGLKEPFAPVGNPLMLRFTEPENPLRGVNVTVTVALEPAMMHAGVVGVTEKS